MRASRQGVGRCLVAVLASFLLAVTARAEETATPEFRSYGVLIHVPDIEGGLAFFQDSIGLSIADRQDGLYRLAGETPLFLTQSASAELRHGESMPRTSLVFQTTDIAERQEQWRQRGVDFLDPEPTPNGVGVASRWRDSFGTVYALLEQRIAAPPPFTEPHIYNYGFVHRDVGAVRGFYIDLLGFAVRTESFFPPALPLGNADGSFGFMLHQDTEIAETAQRPIDGAGVSILFATDDLEAAEAYLRAADVPVRRVDPAERGGRRVLIIRDPAGVESEVWETPAD